MFYFLVDFLRDLCKPENCTINKYENRRTVRWKSSVSIFYSEVSVVGHLSIALASASQGLARPPRVALAPPWGRIFRCCFFLNSGREQLSNSEKAMTLLRKSARAISLFAVFWDWIPKFSLPVGFPKLSRRLVRGGRNSSKHVTKQYVFLCKLLSFLEIDYLYARRAKLVRFGYQFVNLLAKHAQHTPENSRSLSNIMLF